MTKYTRDEFEKLFFYKSKTGFDILYKDILLDEVYNWIEDKCDAERKKGREEGKEEAEREHNKFLNEWVIGCNEYQKRQEKAWLEIVKKCNPQSK